MSSRPVPPDLQPWAMSCSKVAERDGQPDFRMIAGDASNRRYFRLCQGENSFIVAEAPPATENNAAFLAVRDVMAAAGVRVPVVHAADLDRGYLLLEDLGRRPLLPLLDATTVDRHYRAAFDCLRKLASVAPATLDLPCYDSALLQEELGRFSSWFCQALLDCAPGEAAGDMLEALCHRLVGSAQEQPRVLVHRDFHSRNLMLQADGALAVIDFQDAVVGPVTYDLVSLLRDCYVRWPRQQVIDWAVHYHQTLKERNLLADIEQERFLAWFDLMGLQRHLKVLGTFARLHLRDGKPGYLQDLPQVVAYVREIAGKYAGQDPVIGQFQDWFEGQLVPVIERQAWSTAR